MSERPRVRVAAVLPMDGSVVLVAHVKDGRRYHLLPGGGVEAGETLASALRREVLEETGLRCEPVRPLFVSDTVAPDGSRHVVNITFLAEVEGGSLTAPEGDPRVLEVVLAEPAQLVAMDLRPPMADAIAEAAGAGYDVHARYLGALWTEEPAD